MSFIVQELLIDPWHRLKWCFIPVKREVSYNEGSQEELTRVPEIESEKAASVGSSKDCSKYLNGEIVKDQVHESIEKLEVQDSVRELSEYEVRDEAIRNDIISSMSKNIELISHRVRNINGIVGSTKAFQPKKKSCC